MYCMLLGSFFKSCVYVYLWFLGNAKNISRKDKKMTAIVASEEIY